MILQNKIKIMLIIFLSWLILISTITACNNTENTDKPASDKLSIITTIFPQYDFTKQIAGEKVDLKMLLKPGAESHSYEPTPQDIKLIQASDLFIYTGGENDTWIEGIINSMGSDAPQTMRLIDLVDTVEEEIIEGMEHDHDHDHEKDHDDEEDYNREHDVHEIDEHVWTSPINAIEIVKEITDYLLENDQVNADYYKENSEKYIKELQELDQQFVDIVQAAERNVILFGDRFPFRYLADQYDLDYYAAFSGCSTNTEASAATVAFLIDKVEKLKLPVVFSIELSNEKISDSITETTGAEKLTFHSLHNLSIEELAANETYISLMQKNLRALEKALN
ncbi:MAG: metal ABC transporter substrate-binding protein [Saccharofermentanales bacterium]|jgi:zinc transport system substrate-binding protein|nr:metal ABC transporter substrate-binding protein [Bacillota bacterium]